MEAFAKSYLKVGTLKPKQENIDKLVRELAPDMADFWSVVGPEGERIALDEFDAVAWQKTLQTASDAAFRNAVERLPASARRFRAEYTREEK